MDAGDEQEGEENVNGQVPDTTADEGIIGMQNDHDGAKRQASAPGVAMTDKRLTIHRMMAAIKRKRMGSSTFSRRMS
jgi:hypothetical protein